MGAATTTFFIPGVGPLDTAAETIYRQLGERSAFAAGIAATPRRIFRLNCRIESHDCEIEVGRPMPDRGGDVVAIFDHGRHDGFAVHIRDLLEPVRVGSRVYSVEDFSLSDVSEARSTAAPGAIPDK
jgi:hypothetical protein